MDCKKFQTQYESYVSDDLPPSKALAFEEHVQNCSQCALWFEMQQTIGEALRVSAQASLPPEHYFEGLFQRTAPRLIRANRWSRIRDSFSFPFEAFFFSNRWTFQLARMGVICAIGVVIGFKMGGEEALTKLIQTQGRELLTSTKAEAVRVKPAEEASKIWSGFSNAMQRLVSPKMPDNNVAPAPPELSKALEEKKVFEQIDLVKYTIIRDGDLTQLPRILKIENDLVNAGQIQNAETWAPRRQCALVRDALQAIGTRDGASAMGFLAEVVSLNPESRWACLAQYLSASILEKQGQRHQAATLYKSCLEKYPEEYLNANQAAHARTF